MPKKIVVLQGHPDGTGSHLCHALAEAYQLSAEKAGHAATIIDVSHLEFPLLKRREDWEKGETPSGLLDAQTAILNADHLVILYPLWLGTMPALLKAFLEQVLRPTLIKDSNNNPMEWGNLLKGCSARIIITMGMPAFFYRWFYGAHGLKNLKRNILGFSGVGPIRATLIGMVDKLDENKAQKWFEKMHSLGATAS